MPNVLAETIHYSVSDAKDFLQKLRAFAASVGWTEDYWTTTGGSGSDYQLQIFSDGYIAQNMCYRLQVQDYDAQEQRMIKRAVRPLQRGSTFSFSNTYCWGGDYPDDQTTSLPTSSFDLYLYGSKRFISAILHVLPTAVISFVFGTWDLYPSWWYYGPGLFFDFNPQTLSSGSAYTWYNMLDNTGYWRAPMTQRGGSYGDNVWYEGAERDASHYGCNFRPTSMASPSSVNGEFNNMSAVLNYNAFTSKRVAAPSTAFVKDPTLGLWYAVGLSPFAWINGKNLTVGETVLFGTDQYRCFPGVFSTVNVWQAYRIA